MKEFIEKLIGRLEDKRYINPTVMIRKCYNDGLNDAVKIVNQLAEEYKDKEYCWQECASTEHCKECSRLGNGDIDYFESIDDWAESLTTIDAGELFGNSEQVKKTNADRIRSMNDEELAEFIVTFENIFGEEYEGKMSCLDWLQSEAE